ncbi:hypothetical protein, variant [Phialophora macrospora]|uniref:Uncharacterized protein n=1 Tax=Phialophora macrospora TaxID=1851006 RepID=A0A0D2FT52_9EURO|nr:hypothetical protein, variant [Phialophora macrospora]
MLTGFCFLVLRGAKAFQLFLQSWQFILWKQCHALVHQKGLPAELWSVVRDLWTLWLSRLGHRLQDHPSTAVDELADTSGNEADTTASSSGNESDTDPDAYTRRQLQQQQKQSSYSAHNYPKLIDTIALAYIGIIMLRRPVGQATFLRWILEEDVPYIRAIRHVPQDMKDRLPGEYHQSLDTTTRVPGPDDLQKAIYHRARWFNSSFGMVTPSINQNLFLLNYVRRLALPLEVYTTVRRMNTITKYDFTYPDTTTLLGTTRRQPTTYPESQLMSLVVVAAKLLFPFDSDTVKRYPKDANDPTTLRMDWSSWLEAKDSFDKDLSTSQDKNGLKPGSEILVTDRDILGMTDQQLDQYMSWYQRTWIKNSASAQNTQVHGGGSGSMDREVLDMFPLPDVTERRESREQNERLYADEDARLTDRIKQVQHSLGFRRAVSEEEELERGLDLLRPGARYPRFAKIEDLDRAEKVVPGGHVARAFHEEAAQTACLSLKALILAVNRTEEKIELWLAARRREEVFGEDGPNSDGGEASVEDGDLDKDIAVVPETSPPGKLAKKLDELGLGLSPRVEDDDGDVDMQMLPE